MEIRLCWDIFHRINLAVHGLALLATPVVRKGDTADKLGIIVAVGLYKRIKCHIVHELGVCCSQQTLGQSNFFTGTVTCDNPLHKAEALSFNLIFIDVFGDRIIVSRKTFAVKYISLKKQKCTAHKSGAVHFLEGGDIVSQAPFKTPRGIYYNNNKPAMARKCGKHFSRWDKQCRATVSGITAAKKSGKAICRA